MEISKIPTPTLGNYLNSFEPSAINNTMGEVSPAINTQMPNLNLNNGLFGISNNTLQGIGTLASVLGGLWSASRQADYQDKLYNEEKRRIAREEKRQDAFEKGMREVYK